MEPIRPHSAEGDTVTLTCTAGEANPTAQILWYRRLNHMKDSVEDSTEDGDCNSKISISNLTWAANREDNGVIYSCKVDGSNTLQEDNKININCELY